MQKPLVSVIMPLYNGISFVDQAVQSVLDQTYNNWELLVVDDGSKDESFQRAKYWEKQDVRIHALQHQNGANKGVSATRNLAIKNSRGEYLALLDCDDTWVPDKLDIQIDFMLKNPDIVMTYAQAQVIDEKDQPIHDAAVLLKMGRPPIFGNGGGKETIHFEDVIFKIWVPASTAVIKKDISVECGNFDETLPVQVEDILLFTQIAEKGPISFMDKVLLNYRVHSSQWNTKLDKKRKLKGKFLYLLHLISKVNIKNRELLSSFIIWDLFREIVHYSISYSRFDLKFVTEVLMRIWERKEIQWHNKLKGIPIISLRVISVPFMYLGAKLLRKN